jgi:predicted permease
VIGVLPAAFREIDAGDDRDLWFPEDCWKQLGNIEELHARGNRWFRVLARLAPGESVQSANAQMTTLANRMAAAYPQSNRGRMFALESDFDYRLKQAGDNGLAVLAIVLLVVLISSVNVANLLLSRANVRGKEMAVRLALGASRARLMSQLMIESLLLGAFGLALGMTLGWWLIAWMPSLMVTPPGFDVSNDFEFDSRVFVFSFAVTLATTVLFGLVPALRFTRPDLIPALRTDSVFAASSTRPRWPMRNWLVAGEVAIAMTLLVCSGVLVRSFSKTRTSELGFARQETLLVWLASDTATPAFYRDMASRLAALPGVKDVSLAVRAPLSLSSNGMFQRVTFPGLVEFASAPPFEIKYNAVSPQFLGQMGTRVIRGRDFDGREESSTSDAVVINEVMAQRFFGRLDPIGRTIMAADKPRTIVGIARNAPINAIGETPEPYLYLPYWSNFETEVTFMMRTYGDATALAQPARQILKQANSKLEPSGITTMNELIRYSAGRYEMTAELAGALGLLGLILTAVGLYGVVAYGISQRSREIGIRMALGAGAGETRLMVLREVAVLGLAGVAIGLPLALASTRLLASMLFGIGPWDGLTISGSAALLMAVLLFAGFLPVRRATAVAPASVLRSS